MPIGKMKLNYFGLILVVLLAVFLIAPTALAQLEVTEILMPGQRIEPGDNTAMAAGSPATLGDGATALTFKLTDIDLIANDTSGATINCFIVQNLGSAVPVTEIVDVMIINSAGDSVAAPVAVAVPPVAPPVGCPAGSPGPGAVAFEAFVAPAGLVVPDGGMETFQVVVRTAATGVLAAGAQDKTIRLRVIIAYTEDIGSPAATTAFTLTVTDSDQDYVFNGGVNDSQLLTFTPAPIRIGGTGVVTRFRICDNDADSDSLRIDEITLVQGPLGSAVVEDFTSFTLFKISGVPAQWGEITGAALTAAFNRGGAGIVLLVDAGNTIPDDQCADFEVRGTPSIGALIGRVVHLRISASFEEPTGTDIDSSVDLILQATNTVLLGSGVLRIADVQSPGGSIPIQISGFSSPGFGSVFVQTRSAQFDASVIQIEGMTPMPPYQVTDVRIDNRAGILNFTISLIAQTASAKLGIPAPETVATIEFSPKGQPGQRTTIIFQVDSISNADGDEVTNQVGVASGSVFIPFFGDIDQLNDGATLKDLLLLATALLSCMDNTPTTGDLTNEQRRIADVAAPFAPAGTIPDCGDLSSADLLLIARAAITQVSSNSVESAGVSLSFQERQLRALPLWIQMLNKLFPWMLPQVELADVKLVAQIASDELILEIEKANREIGGLQGRITYDPTSMQVLGIEGIGQYTVLASQIDNIRGEIRFAVLGRPDASSSQSEFVRLITSEIHQDPNVNLELQFLLDNAGAEIPFEVSSSEVSLGKVIPLSVDTLKISALGKSGFMIRVQGEGITGVRVDAFDLGGTKRYAAETEGNMLRWTAQDMMGENLANGVYLFVVTAKGIEDQRWQSKIRKVIVLR